MPHIRLIILDVDGVLTSGDLPYSAEGNEIKVFHVQDGGAVKLWNSTGGLTALISGRESPAVNARAKDLDIQVVVQGVPDKIPAYETICRTFGVSDAETSFIGDDLLDLEPMRRCGYPIAVANANPLVKRAACYVTNRAGGFGAIAEVVERLMRYNGTWAEAMARFQA